MGLLLDFVAEIGAEEVRRLQVDLSAQQIGKLRLHGEEGESRRATWLEFHEHVHIAFGVKRIAYNRAEKRQLANVMAAAEVVYRFRRYLNGVGFRLIFVDDLIHDDPRSFSAVGAIPLQSILAENGR